MNAFSAVSHAMNISPTSYTLSRNLDKIPNQWAWDLYSYLFTTLFGAFAVICAVAFIRQWMQVSPSRNMYGRFTTVQLFLAATLKVIGHLCTPTSLGDATTEIFLASLLIETFSKALLLSTFSIMLLILLETTKISLAAPRLQNIWMLLGITAVFLVVLLTLNLLVLYGSREIWFLISNFVVFIWGLVICIGYTVAGYRMWRNLKSSRQLGQSTSELRLKYIVKQAFLAAFTALLMLALDQSLAAKDYVLFADRQITSRTIWSRYTLIILKRSCEFAMMALIFGIVVSTKHRGRFVQDSPAVQLGTFVEDTTLTSEK